MCGIFAALGPLPEGAADAVSRALAHRGPDAEGRRVDGECTLVHRRLKIIDLSELGAQPMLSDDGDVQVVFNGEIYNHHLLRAELEARGVRFRSRSDTEAIVRGYEVWGDAVVERLDGMFAFALWDRARRRLLVARDRAGKKPLFYSTRGGVFRCASTVAALHASGLPRGMSVQSLPMYLAYGFVPAPATLHDGVEQLAPASRLVVERGAAPRVDVYWRPRFGEVRTRDSFAAASAKVRALTVAAVERRLESDVPLGAFLSGGIDSTIVVGVMARAIGRVRTFSIGFAGDPRYDETHYARIAARAFGSEHTEFTLQPSSFELVETLVRHHDGPFGDSSAIPTYVVSQLTRQHVTVALTGDGGDELFCGYVRLLAAEAAERIPAPLRVLAARAAARLPDSPSERSLSARARRFVAAAALPAADRIAAWNTFFPPASILRADVAAELGAAVDAPLAWQRAMWNDTHGATVLSRLLEHNFRTYLPYDLMVKSDRCSMAHALEARAPFLDTALVEYAATLPPGYLRRGADTKRILKHAFADLLPPPIRTRGKMGFGVPLGAWFRQDLRAYLGDHLADGARLWQWLDRAVVSRLVDEHQRGARDHGQKLWALLTLEIWLRSLAAEARAVVAA
ncbi:MAG TPA: asparagine synthase (glutamine-hydrolyzing) [Polyangia bacterium]|nr:asparagine synthase (glutamine-hydrolyzing) [Polyangia bacterium]